MPAWPKATSPLDASCRRLTAVAWLSGRVACTLLPLLVTGALVMMVPPAPSAHRQGAQGVYAYAAWKATSSTCKCMRLRAGVALDRTAGHARTTVGPAAPTRHIRYDDPPGRSCVTGGICDRRLSQMQLDVRGHALASELARALASRRKVQDKTR